jgi:hypothetical protein
METLTAEKTSFYEQLSKHLTGAYIELCREVGKSFEAVRAGSFTSFLAHDGFQETQMHNIGGFSATIQLLEKRNKEPPSLGEVMVEELVPAG